MRTIFAIFLCALLGSLFLTPLAGWLGEKYKFVDRPSERKVHTEPIPRIGGLAIYLAYFFAFIPILYLRTEISDSVLQDKRVIFLACGSVVAFVLGFIDDIKGQSPLRKLAFQIIAGIIAFAGGIKINVIGVPGFSPLFIEMLALPVTVFWIVLVINAINLIDGLDGLAAGVSFFVCIILMILCVLDEKFVPATLLAALGGATLGFLRYNYNPASIFMGDGGSYFIGYMLATVSIVGSFKGQTAVSILIPMIALGLPLMDVLWATVRRFVFGQKIFRADRDHVHHRLLAYGLTQQRVVLIFYGITILMGAVAMAMVYSNDARTAMLLLLLAVGAIVGIQRLGYLNFMNVDRVLRWGRDVSFEMGISRKSRMFFSSQIEISESKTEVQFWENIIKSAKLICVDYIEIDINGEGKGFCWHLNEKTKNKKELYSKERMYMRLPLEHEGEHIGVMYVSKNMFKGGKLQGRTLRHIAYLRSTVSQWLYENKK